MPGLQLLTEISDESGAAGGFDGLDVRVGQALRDSMRAKGSLCPS